MSGIKAGTNQFNCNVVFRDVHAVFHLMLFCVCPCAVMFLDNCHPLGNRLVYLIRD